MKATCSIFAISFLLCGCEQSGKEYDFVVPKGYVGDLVIAEKADGVDAYVADHLMFDSTGKVYVRDNGFLSRWNKIHFVFPSGERIYSAGPEQRRPGRWYVTEGAMDSDHVMRYKIWKEEHP